MADRGALGGMLLLIHSLLKSLYNGATGLWAPTALSTRHLHINPTPTEVQPRQNRSCMLLIFSKIHSKPSVLFWWLSVLRVFTKNVFGSRGGQTAAGKE